MSRSGAPSIKLRGPWKIRWENFRNKQEEHKREIGVSEGKPGEGKMFDQTHTPAVGGEVLWVEAEIDGEPAKVIVDTGAGATMFGGHWLKRMRESGKMPARTRSEAASITGLNSDSHLTIEYTAQVVLTMGNTHVMMNTLVTPDLQYDMLLGNEILKDVELHTMTLGHQRYIYCKAEPGQPPTPTYVAAATTKGKPKHWLKKT